MPVKKFKVHGRMAESCILFKILLADKYLWLDMIGEQFAREIGLDANWQKISFSNTVSKTNQIMRFKKHIKAFQQFLRNKCGSKRDVYCIFSEKFQQIAFRIEILQCEMLNPARFRCVNLSVKVLEIIKMS